MSTTPMTAVLTGSSSVTVTHRGSNPAVEKKLRLDRRVVEVEKELAEAREVHQAVRTTARNRARRALTAYNKAKTAREGAKTEIEGLKARIAELEASIPSLDEALVRTGSAHESATAAELSICESSPEMVNAEKTLEHVQLRIARHLAAHPEAGVSCGSGEAAGEDGGDRGTEHASAA